MESLKQWLIIYQLFPNVVVWVPRELLIWKKGIAPLFRFRRAAPMQDQEDVTDSPQRWRNLYPIQDSFRWADRTTLSYYDLTGMWPVGNTRRALALALLSTDTCAIKSFWVLMSFRFIAKPTIASEQRDSNRVFSFRVMWVVRSYQSRQLPISHVMGVGRIPIKTGFTQNVITSHS